METPPATPTRGETIETGTEEYLDTVIELPLTPAKTPNLSLGRWKLDLGTATISNTSDLENIFEHTTTPPTTTEKPLRLPLEKSKLGLGVASLSAIVNYEKRFGDDIRPPPTPTKNPVHLILERSTAKQEPITLPNTTHIEKKFEKAIELQITLPGTLTKTLPELKKLTLKENTASTRIFEKTVELPVTPTKRNTHLQHGISETNETTTTTLPSTTTPIFCCTSCSSFLVDKEPFVPFSAAIENSISTIKYWAQIHTFFIHHMIELLPTPSSTTACISSRFFVCLHPNLEYCEVSADLFSAYEDTREVYFKVRCWFTCPEHRKGYQLLRFEHISDVNVGYGLKERELSPFQRAREKRNFLIRKLSYGMQKD